MMQSCHSIREHFSAYLDGALTGVLMQEVASHLQACAACKREFADWRSMQAGLSSLGPAKAPVDLALRLRVALSQEQARTPRRSFARWQVRWENSVAPFLWRASAGFASAVVLLGTAALLVGAFASPQPVEARDASVDAATGPRFLYSMISATTPVPAEMQPASLHESRVSGAEKARVIQNANAVVVEAYVNRAGRVYDYRIISGPNTPAARAQIENLLLFSVFEPAHASGEPIRGVAVLSFSGIAVQG
jgi:negative regulator of sigma E activity